MSKVEVIKAFIDREADMMHREIGEQFEVTQQSSNRSIYKIGGDGGD